MHICGFSTQQICNQTKIVFCPDQRYIITKNIFLTHYYFYCSWPLSWQMIFWYNKIIYSWSGHKKRIIWIPDADALLFFCSLSYFWVTLKIVFRGLLGHFSFYKILSWFLNLFLHHTVLKVACLKFLKFVWQAHYYFGIKIF